MSDPIELALSDAPTPLPLRLSSWTLHVENLGKLSPCDVRTHPLMLLVGDNNAGKTYLTTMLYGLVNELDEVFPPTPLPSPHYDACLSWLKAWLGRPLPSSIALTPDFCAAILAYFNAVLASRASALTEQAFNNKGVAPGLSLQLRDLELHHQPTLAFYPTGPDGDPAAMLSARATIPFRPIFNFYSDALTSPEALYRLVQYITAQLLGPAPGGCVYLPASRSGFVQLFRESARASNDRRRLRPRFVSPSRLTAPMVDFMDFLSIIDTTKRGLFAEEADLLQAACLDGQLEAATDGPVNDYAYRPSGAAEALPMTLSSAVVTELAPIVLSLRHEDMGMMILEEPEAHLHPKLQRALAQTIVRLVRKGLYVCITTHSENFCQQINNFMKIGALADPSATAQSLGYGPQDFLKADEVGAYEFRNKGDHAEVRELPRTRTGLEMPLFNEELLKLSEETLKLQDLLAEAEGDAS